MVRDKSTAEVLTMQQSEIISLNGCELSFYTPNNVSIFASIAKKELRIAKRLYREVVSEKITKKKDVAIKGGDLSKLYNYLEHVQTSVICVYTAVEALANVAIPRGYQYETRNSKGVSEVWDKEAIERWFKTSDKYTKLIPGILEIENPSTKDFWSKFKELEVIRNEIVHQKTSVKKPDDVDSYYLVKLIKSRVFDVVESGFELISYVCNSDQAHAFFPLGFGPAQIRITELNSLVDSFKLIKKASPD